MPGLKNFLNAPIPFAGPRRQAVRPAAASATATSIQQIPAVGTPNCFSVFKATVCPPSKLLNPLNPPIRSQDRPRPTFFRVFKAAVCPALNPLNAPNPLQGAPQASLTSSSRQGHSPFNSTDSSGWHAQLFFRVFKATVCPPLKLLNPLNPPSRSQDRPRPTVFKGVQGCRLPGLKPLKRSGPAGKPSVQQQPGPQPLQFNKFQRLARPTVFQSLQGYRLPALKASKPSKPSQPQPGQATSNCF